MEPTLAWLDFNAAERERTQRVLALFEERETRDELGLGAIRDSFSDHLFPGTSTIQTRLRYVFFIPWIYRHLERQRIPAADFAGRARKMEVSLTKPLLEQADNDGVFGKRAKGELKRLPSSVYWAALRLYGISLYPGSREDYHRDIGAIYRRRDRTKRESDGAREAYQFTWHSQLPHAPADFPEHPTFRLTKEEAQFFRDCLMTPACRGSLLAYLAWHCKPAKVEFPWEHPEFAAFSEQHRELLAHGRLFAETMHGAAILYNLMLAETGARDLNQKSRYTEQAEACSEQLEEWSRGLTPERRRIREWDRRRLWEVVRHPNHTVTARAREFVESWVTLVLDHGAGLAKREDARRLVRDREMRLKGPRSRFLNRRALEQWGGEAGLRPMAFRWRNANILLHDLAEGLKNR